MNTLSLSYQGKSITVENGQYSRGVREFLKAQGLKGKARREAYYSVLDSQRPAVNAGLAENNANGWKTEIVRVGQNKAGRKTIYFKQFQPVGMNAKDARIVELEAKLAKLEGKAE